jgi:hypothetical protein
MGHLRAPSPDDATEEWAVYGIPAFITKQVEPGTVLAFTLIYEPTEANEDRYRISAVKVVGVEQQAAA